jgi:hypothetical protein
MLNDVGAADRVKLPCAAAPVPAREINSGLAPALLLTAIDPITEPTTDGANCTSIVQALFPPRVPPLREQVVPAG